MQLIVKKNICLYGWNQQEWLNLIELEGEYDLKDFDVNKSNQNLSSFLPNYEAMNLSIDEYHENNKDSLTFDDSEFLSCTEEETPTQKPKKKSETDPYLLDYISVVSSSESESEFDCTKLLQSSSPISWSPQKIQCDKVQNLESVLENIHENHVEFQKIEQGRVYPMETVLEAVHNPSQAHTHARRTKKRHDYNIANKKGFSEK